MSDPLSVAASCVGLITAAGATASGITSFFRGCREARGDLTAVARELADLQITLELLRADAEGGSLPAAPRAHVVDIVDSCGGLVRGIDAVLARHAGGRGTGAVRWAIDGKREVEGLRRGLEAYRGSLSLAVETVTLALAQSIKRDTEEIRGHTQDIPGIRDDIEWIRYEIEGLRVSLPAGEDKTWSTGGGIEDYLDGLTSYAETVCDPDDIWESDEDEDLQEQPPLTDGDPIPKAEPVDDAPAGSPDDKPPPKFTISREASDAFLRGLEPQRQSNTPESQPTQPSPTLETKTESSQPPSKPKPPKPHCHGCGKSVKRGPRLRFISNDCKHRMCDECIRSRFLSSLEEPPRAPRCCEVSVLFPRHAVNLLDKDFTRRWNKMFNWSSRVVKVSCPSKTCRARCDISVDSDRRDPQACWTCKAVLCSWCYKEWHGKLGSCEYKAVENLQP